MWRGQVDSTSSFKLCFTFKDKIDVTPYFNPGMFTWGYKVRGTGYEIDE